MKAIILVLLTVLTVVLQTAVLAQFPIFGLVPDLLLCLVLQLAFQDGFLTAAMVGMAGGLVFDLLYGWPLGAVGLVYLLFGLAAGTLLKRLDTKNIFVAVVLTGFLAFVKEVCLIAVAKLAGVDFRIWRALLSGALPSALLTMILMIPLHPLMVKLSQSRLMRSAPKNDFDEF